MFAFALMAMLIRAGRMD